MNIKTETWPISKCNGRKLMNWVFIEETVGTYEQAIKRAAELQNSDSKWQYRIWDCR